MKKAIFIGAGISGRWAIQHLSALDNKKFIGEK